MTNRTLIAPPPKTSPVLDSMTGAQVLVQTLKNEGVELVFGYPGGAIMPIYDALYDSGLNHILCRHEQGAALAADGYARATGQLGVCMATSGPGATNLVTGIANAYMDSVPMLAITGQVASPMMGTDAFQEVDIFGITMPIVKHSYIIRDADELQEIVLEAMHIATSGRPGPVLVDIPKDITLQPARYVNKPNRPAKTEYTLYKAPDLNRAKLLLRNASKPIVYVGGGTVISGNSSKLQRFVEHHQLPTVTTLKALGTIPTTSGLFLGMLGMHGTKAANHAVQECDLLICLGARFDDRVTGKLDEFAPHARVVHVDIDPAEISKLRTADVSLPGEIGPVLDALTDLEPVNTTDWLTACQADRVRYAFSYDYPGEDIYAPALLKELTRLFDHPFIACDVGQHQMWVAQHCDFLRPEQHLTSGGLGAMGYGLPAAIGAQLGNPEQSVVVVSGDGSFMMNVQELATLNRYQLPVKIILLDNACLGMVRQWQELFFEQRYSETQLPDNPDFSALATGFGIPAKSIDKADEIQDGLRFLHDTEGPCLLHVIIDPRANVWPLVPPGQPNHIMLEKAS
jgi:acetolactate synthase-1/2/3 large subunit